MGGALQLLGVEPGSWFSLDLQNAHLNLEQLGHFFICQFRTTGYYNWLAFLFNLFFSQSNSSRTFFSRVQFIHSVVSDCWRPHGLQHMRLPCPSPTPRVYSESYPSSGSCHPTISSSCHPLLLPPSVFPRIKDFSNDSVLLIKWPKYWNFSFNISPSNEYSGLISCRMDWLDLLTVQGTLKSLLQHHSSKASIL